MSQIKIIAIIMGMVTSAGAITMYAVPELRPAFLKSEKSTQDSAAKEEISKKTDRAEKQKTETPQKTQLPTFHIVRVEKSGSVLIAGNAQPNSKVSIVSDGQIIGKATAASGGDFVIILDKDLMPGDYQLSIAATGADEKVLTSQEIATVSIPENDTGEILAMVAKPGEASRILSAPVTAKLEEEKVVLAKLEKPQVPSPEVKPEAAKLEQKVEEVAEVKIASTEQVTAKKETVEAAGEIIKTEVTEKPAEEKTTQPAGEVPVVTDAKPETEAAAATEAKPATPVEKPAEEKIAEVKPVPEPKKLKTPVPASIRVDAVEIEGAKMFIAGSASAGTKVSVYANDTLVGSTVATKENRFLIEENHTLSVGDHVIRAEMADALNNKIIARAIVPFNRPEGALVAAVAAVEEAVKPESTQEAAKPVVSEAKKEIATAKGTTTPAKAAEVVIRTETVTTATEVASETIETVQPALSSTDNSVIIRRGDTLWQISRRVYGQGVRYTTIYLANQNQIHNPDRISPGQIFSVPNKALDNSEELHRERILKK